MSISEYLRLALDNNTDTYNSIINNYTDTDTITSPRKYEDQIDSPEPKVQIPEITELIAKIEISDTVKEEKWNFCEECNCELQRKNANQCVCPKCGFEILDEDTTDPSISNMNSRQSYHAGTPMRLVGNGFRTRNMSNQLMGVSSTYEPVKRKKLLDTMYRPIYNCPNNKDTIPSFVIESAAQIYIELQKKEGIVKRAGGLESILTGLVASECKRHNIARKPGVLTNALNVDDSKLSQGCKILREYGKRGIIDFYEGTNENILYINQYFDRLELKDFENYKDFIVRLIDETQVKKIPTRCNTTRPTTRIAGGLLILCDELRRLGKLANSEENATENKPFITKDKIADVCDISKSTISRYITLVNSNKTKPEIAKLFADFGFSK